MTASRRAATLALLTAAVAGCGHTGATPSSRAGVRTMPDIAAFLRQPVATPSVCPTGQSGSASGRRSPWAGHIDFSVFLTVGAPAATVPRISRLMTHSPRVQTIYYEGPAQAYAEFQRLYTCWAQVPRSQTPASYRVILKPTVTIAERNTLVARLLRQPGVDTVSCDPSLPCTSVVQSAATSPRH
ncbi:MAG: permease-like cell division protein FtsX [Mycobacteriales bacterium]